MPGATGSGPFDFTQGRLKSGGAPEDVYRTFMTGLNAEHDARHIEGRIAV